MMNLLVITKKITKKAAAAVVRIQVKVIRLI